MKNTTMDFNFKYHLIGRIWLIIGILLFFSVPVSIGVYYNVVPDWSVFANQGVIILLFLNLGACLGEPILYAPMLGTNGEYLAFITGNLSNLKIPCVVRAHEIYEADRKSEEYEIISTISVAMSTLITILIIGIFVLILALSSKAINSLTANEWIRPAFSCVVYALFGSLGGKYCVKNPKMAIPSIIVIVVMSVILGFLHVDPGSTYLMIGIAICLVCAIIQIAREKKKNAIKDEEKRIAEIANGNPEIETNDTIIENTEDVDTEETIDNIIEEPIDNKEE